MSVKFNKKDFNKVLNFLINNLAEISDEIIKNQKVEMPPPGLLIREGIDYTTEHRRYRKYLRIALSKLNMDYEVRTEVGISKKWPPKWHILTDSHITYLVYNDTGIKYFNDYSE